MLLPIRSMFSIRHPHFLPRNPAVTTLLTKQKFYHYCFGTILAWMVLAHISVLIRGLCRLFDYYPYISRPSLSTFSPANDRLQTFLGSGASRAVLYPSYGVHHIGSLA